MKKHWLLLILIVAIFLLLCWSLWWSNYGLKTVRYTVGGMSLPEGFNGYHIVLHTVSRDLYTIEEPRNNAIGNIKSNFHHGRSFTMRIFLRRLPHRLQIS